MDAPCIKFGSLTMVSEVPPLGGVVAFLMADGTIRAVEKQQKDDMYKVRLGRKLSYNFEHVVKDNWDYETLLFFTLTYDEQHYPAEGESMDCGADFREFMNRIKNSRLYKKYPDMKISYFAVVERGTKNHRSHLHFAINLPYIDKYYVQEMWQKGGVHFRKIVKKTYPPRPGEFAVRVSPAWSGIQRYVAKYITKKNHGEPGGDSILVPPTDVALKDYWRHIIGRKSFTSRDFKTPPPGNAFPICFLSKTEVKVVEETVSKKKVKYVQRGRVGAVANPNAVVSEEVAQEFITKAKEFHSKKMKKVFRDARYDCFSCNEYRRVIVEEKESFPDETWKQIVKRVFVKYLEVGFIKPMHRLVFRKVWKNGPISSSGQFRLEEVGLDV